MSSDFKEKITFWPDNGYSLSFGILLSLGVYGLWFHQMERPTFLSIPLFLFFVVIIFFYRQTIVIKDNIVHGPSAYGNIRRTKIKKEHTEAFYTKKKFGFGYIVIRDLYSNKQIFASTSLFSFNTLNKLRQHFPAKKCPSDR